MSINYPVIHEGYVPAYQASAIPYVTCSSISVGEIHEINFNQVTRFFNVQNTSSSVGDEIAVAFTLSGLTPASSNYFVLNQGVSFRDEIRTTKLFISCSAGTGVRYQIVAGLTNIPSNQFLTITGSNGHQGVG
jgi:hypothetical protein